MLIQDPRLRQWEQDMDCRMNERLAAFSQARRPSQPLVSGELLWVLYGVGKPVRSNDGPDLTSCCEDVGISHMLNACMRPNVGSGSQLAPADMFQWTPFSALVWSSRGNTVVVRSDKASTQTQPA